MKKMLLTVLFFLIAMPVNADMVLTGGIKHNVESARNELTSMRPVAVTGDLIRLNIYDYQTKLNRAYLLKGHTELKDRTLASFSDGSYAVMYHNDPCHVWYYGSGGVLTHAEVKDKLSYPHKSYKYDTAGNLVNMGYRVSKGETFIYEPTGKLIAHWVGPNGYDENNTVVMTRKYVE